MYMCVRNVYITSHNHLVLPNPFFLKKNNARFIYKGKRKQSENDAWYDISIQRKILQTYS